MSDTRSVRDELASIPSLTGTPPGLDVRALPRDPADLFLAWFRDAVDAAVPEPRAMTLSTVDAAGAPDARVLILKDITCKGWAFASTASSRKGLQLATHPVAALSFWWQPLMRAVRVSGPTVAASREESEADLARRSQQAQMAVGSGEWRLWRVQPSRVEHWQGSPDRRHTRIVDHRIDGGWEREVLRDKG